MRNGNEAIYKDMDLHKMNGTVKQNPSFEPLLEESIVFWNWRIITLWIIKILVYVGAKNYRFEKINTIASNVCYIEAQDWMLLSFAKDNW